MNVGNGSERSLLGKIWCTPNPYDSIVENRSARENQEVPRVIDPSRQEDHRRHKGWGPNSVNSYDLYEENGGNGSGRSLFGKLRALPFPTISSRGR